MPQRTRSNREEGRSRAAAELARCRTSGSMPVLSSTKQASRKASSCSLLAGWSGSSEQAKCDQTPVTRTAPDSSAAAAAWTSPGHSCSVEPPRLRPVSILSWTRAGTPISRAVVAISSSSATV